MSDLVFTEYVRHLATGNAPAHELHERFWKTFRGALVAEMKRRALWNISPACLGFVGGSWSTSEDALEELAHDSFVSVVLERLQGLAAQLEVRSDVEGLVFRNLKNFLTALQKRFDPLGYRIYERLRSAIRQAVSEGRLEVLEGDAGVNNRTLLAFPAAAGVVVAEASQLAEPVRRWADELLPALILAGGSRQKADLLGRLASHLDQLAVVGISQFRFKDLVDALKAAVRPRWHAFGVTETGETAVEDDIGDRFEIVRLVRPDAGYEERQDFARLLACVDQRMAAHEARAKTREYLRRLWEFLKTWTASDEEKRPGQRQLSRFLGIPRDRFRELDDLLRRWVEHCRSPSGRAAPDDPARVENRSLEDCRERAHEEREP